MTKRQRNKKPARAPKQPGQGLPTDIPLNPPDPPLEEQLRQLAGNRVPADQGTPIDRTDVDDLGEITPTAIYEGELEAGIDDDLRDDSENLELLTELELR